MADVIYKKGQSANLNETNVPIVNGQILVTEDKAEMFIDMSDGTRKKISDTNKVSKNELKTINGQELFGEGDITVSGVGATAENNAEIFNDYEDNLAQGEYSHSEGYRTSIINELDWSTQPIIFLSYNPNDSIITLGGHYIDKDGQEQDFFQNNQIAAFRIFTSKSKTSDVVKVYEQKYIEEGDLWEFKIDTPSSDIGLESNTPEINALIESPELFAKAAHTEGRGTLAIDEYTHAEGLSTVAYGRASHSEGWNTKVISNYGHAEGATTEAGYCGHAEGSKTKAGYCAHSEGHLSTASGNYSHAEGFGTKATGEISHASGTYTIASSKSQFVAGRYNSENDNAAFIIGWGSADTDRWNAFEILKDGSAVVKGMGSEPTEKTLTTKKYVDTETGKLDAAIKKLDTNVQTSVNNLNANVNEALTRAGKKLENSAEVFNNYTNNIATGSYSHAEGSSTKSSGTYSHAEGAVSKAEGEASHAEGSNTTAVGPSSHAEGRGSKAEGTAAHVEGFSSEANGSSAHAEGYDTEAKGYGTHSEGFQSRALSDYSHAQNFNTTAQYVGSTAMGAFTTTGRKWQTVVGTNNESNSKALFIVGDGIITSSNTKGEDPSNAFEVLEDGSATLRTMGTTDNSVATKKYVDDKVSNGSGVEISVDQTYNAESENAQSGKAVAQAIQANISSQYNTTAGDMSSLKAVNSWAVKSAIESSIDQNYGGSTSLNAQSGTAVVEAIYENASKTYSPTDGFPQSGIAVAQAIEQAIGNVEAVLDSIIAMQESLIGGAAE